MKNNDIVKTGKNFIKKIIEKSENFLGKTLHDSVVDVGKDYIKGISPVGALAVTFYEKKQVEKLEKFVKGLHENREIDLSFDVDEEFLDRIFIVIDRIDFKEKIDYLVKLYAMLTKKEITNIEFFRGCKILDNGCYHDLEKFKKQERYEIEKNNGGVYLMLGLLESKLPIRGEQMRIEDLQALKLSRMGDIFLELKK